MPLPQIYNSSNETFGNPKSPWETTFLGKALRVLGTGERLGTKYILRPLVESAYPEAAARLKALEGDIYAGDVARAANPNMSPVTAGLTGVALGGLVDPLSYVGIGKLSKVGKALPMFEEALRASEMGGQALRASTFAEQAARGERDLLRLSLPWSEEGVTLLRGNEKFLPVYQTLDTLRSGKVARTVVNKIAPGSVGASEMARSLDTTMNSIARKFNAPAGMNPWLYERVKWLWASIHGHQKFRGENDLVPIADAMRDFSTAVSGTLGISQEEAFNGTRGILRDMLESHPTIGNRVDYDLTKVPGGHPAYKFNITPSRTEDDIILDSFVKNFNLPPNVYGTAHPFDTQLEREAKKLWNVARNRIRDADAYQTDNLYNFTKLWSDNSDYLMHHPTPELLSAIDQNVPSLIPKSIGVESGARPTSKQLLKYTRRLRVVDPTHVEQFIQEGRIPETIPIRMKVKVRGVPKYVKQDFNLHKSLRASGGRLMTPGLFNAVQVGLEQGKFNGDVYETISKLFPYVGISDANDLIYKYGIKVGRKTLVQPGQIQKAFVDDPLQLITRRGMQAERNVLSNQFFDEIKFRADQQLQRAMSGDDSSVDIALHESLKDARLPDGSLRFKDQQNWIPVTSIPELKGYLLDPDAASHLARMGHSDVFINEHLYNFLDKVIRRPTQWLKNYTLSIFPSYHVRNWVTNSWQYYMGETHNPAVLASGLDDSAKFMIEHMGSKKDYLIPGTRMKASELYEALTKRNALGVGFIAPEEQTSFYRKIADYRGLDNYVKKQYQKNGWSTRWKGLLPPEDVAKKLRHGDLFQRVLGQDGEFVKLGFKIGGAFDDHIRIAHIINRLREGSHIDNAIMSMKKHFFDYHDLSMFERNVLKYVFPFYTWSRKNIPFQLEALIREPGRLARFHGFLQGFTGGQNPTEEEFVPDYFKKNFGLRVRKNKNGKYEYFMLKNWISVADLQELAHLYEFFTNSLNPIARVPMELISNHNFFTDQKIDKLEGSIFGGGERQTYMKVPKVPNKMAHLMSSFRPLNTLHNILDNPQDLDTASQVANQFIGRTYPLDVVRGQYTMITAIKDAREAMFASIRSAQRRGASQSEIERLINMGVERMTKASIGIGPELRGE